MLGLPCFFSFISSRLNFIADKILHQCSVLFLVMFDLAYILQRDINWKANDIYLLAILIWHQSAKSW